MAETFRKAKVNHLIARLQSEIVDVERQLRSQKASSKELKTFRDGRKNGLLDALDIVYEVFQIDSGIDGEEPTLSEEELKRR